MEVEHDPMRGRHELEHCQIEKQINIELYCIGIAEP